MTMLCWAALCLEALDLLSQTAISILRACQSGKLVYQTRHVKVVCPVHRCNVHVLLDNVAFWWPNEQPDLKSRLKFVYLSPKVSLIVCCFAKHGAWLC